MMISDVNERLIKPNTNNQASPMKIVLQEVQLMSMTTTYASGGSPLVENYQFMARDYYFSEVDLGFIKNTVTNNTSDEPITSSFQNGIPTQTATNYNAPSRNEVPQYFL
jgi:hypothetical protein